MRLRLYLVAGVLVSLPIAGAATLLMHRESVSFGSLKSVYSALVADGGVRVERNIGYGPHDRHRLDVYRPKTGPDAGPVAVFLYGGGWRDGHRSVYGFVGAALASRGITTVIPDYRLFPEVTFPAFVEDAAAAYYWTLQNVAKNESGHRPVILVGHSAGAHTAALLALDRRYLNRYGVEALRPRALVGLAGPYAFDPTTWPSTRSIFASVANADLARPVSFVRRDAPPALLMHGLDDKVVRLRNLKSLARGLEGIGATVHTREFAQIGHAGLVLALSRPFRWRAPVLDEILAFVRSITR